MECGVPFCHHGCPLGNLIPDWNDLVYRDRWAEASEQLHRTNNFPEFTGRLCPAPCEAACVLEINEGDAVTIKQVELAIVDRAWSEGWIVPLPAADRTGAASRWSGPGRPASHARSSWRAPGTLVTVYERDEAAGGLVRFGVPQFKIDKELVERRVASSPLRGSSSDRASTSESTRGHGAVRRARCGRRRDRLAGPSRLTGARSRARRRPFCDGVPRRAPAGARWRAEASIVAAGKHVVVIGGGDTGADCVANAHREGAASVTQIELLGEPPLSRPDDLTPWPQWPLKLRTSYALEEGGERDFSISTTRFEGAGRVERILWQRNTGTPPFAAVAGTEESHPAELVLLAMGFLGPECHLVDSLGAERDQRGNVAAPRFATSVPASSRPATRGAASRWSCGRSTRDGAAPMPSAIGSTMRIQRRVEPLLLR